MSDSAAFLAQHAETLRLIADVSDEVFSLFHRLARSLPATQAAQYRSIIIDSVSNGEAISRAAGSLVADDRALPAIALTRVRLEQLIVASYLVHEKPEIGLKPYSVLRQ